MDDQKKLKIVINGQEYHSLEDIPEQFRALVQGQVDAAQAEAVNHPGVKIVVQKKFRISAGERSSENRQQSQGMPAIQPSSSSWVLWMAAGIAFLIYYFVKP